MIALRRGRSAPRPGAVELNETEIDSRTVPQPADPAAGAASDTGQALPLRFTGSAPEYFRIWIVNVCLTLLTLGIFSAWAKVRKKRYLYSNTLLDGTPFQYLGQPIPILKGRIIAAALVGAWYVGTHYMLQLLPVVLAAAFVLAPWVVVRSAAFNARYSAYRNMTFQFSGRYWGAVRVLYGWGLATILTLGVAFSWWQQRIKRFLVTHLGFGGMRAEFAASGGQFFTTYLRAGLLMAAGVAALVATAGPFLAATLGPSKSVIALTPLVYSLYVVFYAYLQARLTNLVWNHTRLGPVRFRSTIGARGLAWLYVSNAAAILASAGLLIPWATIRTLKYRAEHFAVGACGELQAFQGSAASAVQAAGAEIGEFFDFDMSV